MKDSRLVFQLYCRHGIVKTHNLAFIECETLQAVFSKDMCPNALTASSKLLCDAVMNFQNNQEEVTLIVSPEKIVLKNYVDDEPDPTKVMHTNLSLEPDEFDNCQIGVDTEVTFCLKELRAILAFSEATTLPLTLQFETAGRPIVFTIDSDSTFEGNFVLATLADQQSQSQAPTHSRAPSTQKRAQSRSSKAVGNRQRSSSMSHTNPGNNGDSIQSARKTGSSTDLDRSQRLESAYDELMNDDDDFDEMMIQNDTTVTVQNSDRTKQIDQQNKRQHVSGVNSVQTVSSKGDNLVKRVRSDSPVAGCSKSSEESPVIPILGSKVKICDTSVTDVAMGDDENQEDEDEPVPGTPPAKRFRSLFFGSSQASQSQTQYKSTNLSTSRVLAQDSDED